MRCTLYILTLILLAGLGGIAQSQILVQEDYCTNGICPFDSLSKARMLFGQPLKIEWMQGEDDSTQHLTFDGIEVYGDENGSIVRYEITSNRYHTFRNITIGDSASAVKKAYGEPQRVNRPDCLIYGSETMFYSFELKKDLVRKIIVGFYKYAD